MRMTKRALSIVLAAMMIMSMLVVGAVSASAADAAAKIGDTNYETLTAALNAANDGDTVTVLANCEGDGWVAPQGKFTTGLTVDFGGYTYTVSGKPVGSAGTESIAFQLLKGNKITFKNGTITADCTVNPRDGKYLQRMIQNYSDLTLDGMTVSMVGAYYDQITVSTCNGSTVIKDSTVNAPDFSRFGDAYTSSDFGGAALTVGTFSSYPSVDVTVKGNSVINGDVNVDPSGANAENFSLKLESGTINGGVNLNETAEAAVDANPEKITTSDEFTKHVAKIGDTYYEKVTEAFAAAVDGDKIDIIGNSAGAGVKVLANRFTTNGITVDFHENTYTIDTTLVGSPGYESQAFHLEKGNKITLMYGTITSENARMLVQNYCDLTLKNMTLTPNNPSYTGTYYTLSNNCGNVVINNTTINANPSAKAYAFDVCRYANYPSVNVTVKGNSVINGNVQIDAGNGDAKDGFSLTLESGTLNGNIDLTEGAETAIEETPAKANVTKADAFNQEAPAGYDWVDNGNGTSKLVPYILTGKAEIEGLQLKAVGGDLDGNDIDTQGLRVLTKVDKDWLEINADEYGYVVAKIAGTNANNEEITQANAKFQNLKKDGGNGEKTIKCNDTANNITGLGDDYVTLAVNGMQAGDKVVARFYVVVGGVTYYANYVNVVEYSGILATYNA